MRMQMPPEATDELENCLKVVHTGWDHKQAVAAVVWSLLWPVKHALEAQLSSRKELAYLRRNCDGQKT